MAIQLAIIIIDFVASMRAGGNAKTGSTRDRTGVLLDSFHRVKQFFAHRLHLLRVFQLLLPPVIKRCLTLLVATASCALAQTTLFFEDFSGASSTDLNGTVPDVRTGGETWIADSGSSAWKADGSIGGSGASNAFLAFSPAAGQVYALSIDANPQNANGDWFALGFSQFASVSQIYAGTPQSVAWMLLRGDRSSDLQTFLGPGTADEVDFASPAGSANLKVVLDTTGAQWTAEWFVNGGSIRQATFATNPTINYIGIGRWADAIGVVDDLTLTTSAVPEPASYTLAFGIVILTTAVWRRRRRSLG